MNAKPGLVRHGLTLFLAGLATGFIVPLTLNPRAGLSGHLEGVMNGTFLVALGCAWPELRLGASAGRLVYGLVIFGGWANWAGTLLSAVLGILAATGLAMVVAVGLTAWHLWRGVNEAPAAPPLG